MLEAAEAHLGLQRKAEEVGVHTQVVVGEVEVLHLEEVVVVVVECRRGQGEEEVEEVEGSHLVEEGVEEVEEEVALWHPLVQEEVVVLRTQVDRLQSAIRG